MREATRRQLRLRTTAPSLPSAPTNGASHRLSASCRGGGTTAAAGNRLRRDGATPARHPVPSDHASSILDQLQHKIALGLNPRRSALCTQQSISGVALCPLKGAPAAHARWPDIEARTEPTYGSLSQLLRRTRWLEDPTNAPRPCPQAAGTHNRHEPETHTRRNRSRSTQVGCRAKWSMSNQRLRKPTERQLMRIV